ncbi:hypothetical protein M6B38_369650 [Iris pallida]|uniref:Uncharacterized protein n=1 Tax=Iris pallida TaxID=29817 RepID=A0AAX6GFA7_IRIPA|nr:hypothetical protein M6B38_369650 [Iris pallida]
MSKASAAFAERCGGSDHLQSGSVARDLWLRRWPASTWQSQQHGLEEVLASAGSLTGRLRRSSQSLRWSTRHAKGRNPHGGARSGECRGGDEKAGRQGATLVGDHRRGSGSPASVGRGQVSGDGSWDGRCARGGGFRRG